ncbi:DUF3137 domain-containing protein [Altererythrobacter lutimaris]|uniref:DUF3137 domain-containing protein n=1 Tax=Altererythrobacter lutimaris TaxID=2743979 RepID=A0A850HAQ5_9SPHN|nr:DUF3137 domain-containing protein [Altererythrobacter lutimaris]NVE94325.1 DUF3137 domain-containing protein [Altererythrobacter lutimaris]
MVNTTSVSTLMNDGLGTWLDERAQMRADAKAKASGRWTKAAFLGLPALAFMWFGPPWALDWKFIISAFIVGGGWAWGYAPIKAAKKEIKVGINSAIARSLGLQYEHDVEPGGEFEAAKTFGLLPHFHKSAFEDQWSGELKGHAFQLYEAHLRERRSSGKNTRYVTVFRGAIIAMDFGQPFHSITLLQRAGKHKKWLGLGGRKDSVSFNGRELHYVDQVHPDFEDTFEVWSDDQVEARTLIHPSYIEQLLEIERAFSGEEIRALFLNGEIILAVESDDMFESGSIEPHDDARKAAATQDQFAMLAGLAVRINQNVRGDRLSDPLRAPINSNGS